jgi:predicted PhzF superfamily epimerase YddE/YHI9
LRPDFALLGQYPVRGVIVTARSDDPDYDFVSRFFAPRAGVPEDPVTGSAHCCLGPYWSERLGKRDLVGYQASARGGTVRVGLRGNRVELGGQAVIVLSGEWLA